MLTPEPQQLDLPDAGGSAGEHSKMDMLGETASARQATAEEGRRDAPPRRKLNDEQEREVARLYAETSMRAAEIARDFAIAESSVYRIAQRHGARLRSTPPTRAQPMPEASTGAAVPTVRSRPHRRASVRTPARGGRQLFRIRFEAEEVLEAVDVRDALRQAAARGIEEITAVKREA